MKWITRKNIKVDRVACPWLIRRFVDPHAEFLFVEENELLAAAKRENAIPFDAPRFAEIKLNHRGPRCSFEAIIEDYQLQAPGLERLGLIVRAADVKALQTRVPEMRQVPNANRRLDDHVLRALNKIRKPSTAEEITELLNRDLGPGWELPKCKCRG